MAFLSVLLSIALSFGAPVVPHNLADKLEIEELEMYLPVEVHMPVTWEFCGTWNGAYYFSGRIKLCEENLDEEEGVARFIYLHELGHAYTMTRHLDFTRWGLNYEAAADEFGAVMSIVQGHPEDVLAMAKLFYKSALERPYVKGDPHPPAAIRAENLMKIYQGFKNPYGKWGNDWRDTLDYWRDQFLEHP